MSDLSAHNLIPLVGIAMVVLSALCLVVNLIVVRIIILDNELYRLSSYKFMLALCAADCALSCVHFATGFFTIYENTIHLWLCQALGAIATPGYIFYTIVTIELALNRLIVLTSFDRLDERLFSPNCIWFWFALPAFVSLSFTLALSTPWAAIFYSPDQLSWAYDYSRPLSYWVQQVEEGIELGGIPMAGLIYTAIFFTILFKRLNGHVLRQTGTIAEVKVLIQAFVITAYCTMLNYLWHNPNGLLPNTKLAKCALNFMWIASGAINPFIYFAVNAAIRRRIGASFGVLSPPIPPQFLSAQPTTALPPLRLSGGLPMQNNFLNSQTLPRRRSFLTTENLPRRSSRQFGL